MYRPCSRFRKWWWWWRRRRRRPLWWYILQFCRSWHLLLSIINEKDKAYFLNYSIKKLVIVSRNRSSMAKCRKTSKR